MWIISNEECFKRVFPTWRVTDSPIRTLPLRQSCSESAGRTCPTPPLTQTCFGFLCAGVKERRGDLDAQLNVSVHYYNTDRNIQLRQDGRVNYLPLYASHQLFVTNDINVTVSVFKVRQLKNKQSLTSGNGAMSASLCKSFVSKSSEDISRCWWDSALWLVKNKNKIIWE